MTELKIRAAHMEDLDDIMAVYRCAKAYMDANGNPNQWTCGYPARDLIEGDIKKGHCYVCIARPAAGSEAKATARSTAGSEAAPAPAETICGVFAFILGTDQTYLYIEDGKWLNDAPYGTIHRIASDGSVKGVFSCCIDFCKSQSQEIRIDTHEDNKTMQHLIEKNGFSRCGIIYTRDHSPRIAYQLSVGGPDAYIIRRAVSGDIDRILALCRTISTTPGCTWGDDYPHAQDLQEDLDQNALFVICPKARPDRIIGCAGAAEYAEIDALSCWDPSIKRPCGLARIGISPEFQGRGAATALLSHIEADAGERCYDGIHFLVSPTNDPALALYHKFGYCGCGERNLFGLNWLCYEKKL